MLRLRKRRSKRGEKNTDSASVHAQNLDRDEATARHSMNSGVLEPWLYILMFIVCR
jgi:hypothetical protein